MRAVVLNSYGDEGVLEILEVPDPDPGPDEVVVRVAATAMNRADLLQRMGLYPGPPMEHEIPGLEFAGVVERVGSRVDPSRIGSEVMGIVAGGAHAELVVTHERTLIDIPTGIALTDAAAIPEVFITAFDALVVQGGLASGGTALVHAGASGVGTASIQIARAIGARVVVSASASKLDKLLALGATAAVDRRAGDFVEVCRSVTDGAGVDVVLDVVGGDYVQRNIDALALGGRIIQVGVMGGGRTEINVGELLRKRASITGTTLRARPIEEKIAISRRFAMEMVPWFTVGALRPVIDRRYEFDDIAEAHRYMATNESTGKILIDI